MCLYFQAAVYVDDETTSPIRGARVTVMTASGETIHSHQVEYTSEDGSACIPVECGSALLVSADWSGQRLAAVLNDGIVLIYSITVYILKVHEYGGIKKKFKI